MNLKGIDLVGESSIGKELIPIPNLLDLFIKKLEIGAIKNLLSKLEQDLSIKLPTEDFKKHIDSFNLDIYATKDLLNDLIKKSEVITLIDEATKPLGSQIKSILKSDRYSELSKQIVELEYRLNGIKETPDRLDLITVLQEDLARLVNNIANLKIPSIDGLEDKILEQVKALIPEKYPDEQGKYYRVFKVFGIGKDGLVPRPTQEDATAGKVLKADGTWGTSGGGTWGSITGTLSDQTDLQNALDGKLNLDGSNANQDIDIGAYSLSAGSIKVNGTNGAGHIHLKHQASDATSQASSTTLFADSNGDIKYKNDNLYYTTFITSGNTANRAYTFPDASGTVALTSDLSSYVPTSRTISTTAPLTGGGDLSANRTLGITDAVADGATKGAATFNASDFNSASGVISIDYASGQSSSASTKGFLTSADWTTFNNKQAAGNYITALTGDVTASGPGSVSATIANSAVTNAKLADMAQSTFKGRALGAGTGAPTDLTATQATAILNNFVGDSGLGGTKGLVPAPSAGDSAKFLQGNGTWGAPVTLTTTGTGGAATFVSNILNIPQYQTAGTYTTSVSGTANRITSTGGTTPVIDISASYVGQTSITTLGTVTTGTWNGTPIAVANGGTGGTNATDGLNNLLPAQSLATNSYFLQSQGNSSLPPIWTKQSIAFATQIDFGTTPTQQKIFTVTNSQVSVSSLVTCNLAYTAPAFKELDENEFAQFQFACGQIASGQFQLLATSTNGPVVGKFRVIFFITNPV